MHQRAHGMQKETCSGYRIEVKNALDRARKAIGGKKASFHGIGGMRVLHRDSTAEDAEIAREAKNIAVEFLCAL